MGSMKKAFLNSASPISLLRPPRKEAAPPAPPNDPPKAAEEKKQHQKPDRSAHLMAQTIGMAIIRMYNVDPNDFHYVAIKVNGYNGFTFRCREDADDEEREIIMGRVAECINELDDLNINPRVMMSAEKATVVCQSKMGLYELLESYIEENEDALLTVDSFYDAAFSEEGGIATFSKEAARLFAESDGQTQLLGTVEPRAYLTREHYEAAMMGGHYAHLKLSMQHIRQTIEQEDGLEKDRNRHNHLVLGGYH
ncbi:MAG: hypothetical protein DI626_03195 [Micavibrio aeruginosavorus]|uniref:Uncharacterized protein n=1 Tax=Micavibrio aeruginosavorus TaxID=349221 RepID=A0A2W5A5T5_9BACT|nr:MAG: hypothetical protein DI626_03195 [Micavibrio aeruginosavorus]